MVAIIIIRYTGYITRPLQPERIGMAVECSKPGD